MSSVSDDDDEDDEVDLYRQRKLKGDGDDSASSQAVLLYQGVARLPNADANINKEYVLTVVEDIFDTTRECHVHCSHIDGQGKYYRCCLTPHLPTASIHSNVVRLLIKGLLSRLQIVNGKLVVGPSVEDLSAVRDIVAGLPEQAPNVDTTSVANTPRVGSWDDASAVLTSVQKSGRIRVRIVTWNMQAKAPPSIDTLRAELFPEEKFHIYAIGSEECENSIAWSVVNPSKAQWESILQQALGSSYVMVCGHTLQATHSIVFAHAALVPFISDVKSHAVSTGVKIPGSSRLGNKGGIGISLTLGAHKMVFINAHLAHAKKGLSKRNEEYHTITSQLGRKFAPHVAKEGQPAEACKALLESAQSLFWAGDLNYRLECDRASADDLIAAGDYSSLLEHDQLLHALARQQVFSGLSEAPITFPPTYKFDSDSDTYDTSKKQRVPSWTDRVLFKAHNDLVVLSYASAPNIRTSDHRAVHASFSLAIQLDVDEAPAEKNNTSGKPDIGQNTSQVCTVM